MKVIIIGLDGASWNYIIPILNKLPTIRKLLDNGCYGDLESTIPPITIPAWVSMFTGKNPGKIGVVGFTERVGKSEFNLVTSEIYRKHKSLWDLLSSENIKTLVLNLPFTYPPYSINGHMICIDFSPRLETNPKYLKEILSEEYGINQEERLHFSEKSSEEEKLKIIYYEEDKVFKIALRLLKEYNYDVSIIRFGIPDHVSHATTNEDELTKCYVKLDRYLNKIINKVDYDCLFLVSDHGLEKISKRLAINTWLLKSGFLRLNRLGKLYFIFSKILFRIGVDRIIKAYKFLRKILKKIESKSAFNFDAPGNQLLLNSIDFNKTSAFLYQSISLKTGCIYVLKESEINLLVKLLSTFKDSSGKLVFTDILKKYEVFKGDKLEQLPDIIVRSKDYCIVPAIYPDIFFEREIFTHSDYGIFLAYGKGIKKGRKIEGVKIYDIVPTILHILGLPIPNDVDGKVLMEIFEEDSEFAKRDPVYVDPNYYERKKDEKEILKSKIKELKLKGKFKTSHFR